MHTLKILLMALIVTAQCSGCVLVPFVNAFKQTGVAEGDRKALLAPEVKKFSDGISWGNKGVALDVVADESREAISKQLRGVGEEERVWECKVDDVIWTDDAYKAKVSVKVRYYKVPFYVVKTRIEEQRWEFSLAKGWKLVERSVVEG
jgi:hypothetical protein